MTFFALKWAYLRLHLLKTSPTGLKIFVWSMQKKVSPTLFFQNCLYTLKNCNLYSKLHLNLYCYILKSPFLRVQRHFWKYLFNKSPKRGGGGCLGGSVKLLLLKYSSKSSKNVISIYNSIDLSLILNINCNF